MTKFPITEAELPKRMRKFLADIDEGRVFNSKTLQRSRPSISSALRGLVDTGRGHGMPEALSHVTAEAFLARLVKEGWQQSSLRHMKVLLRHYAYETGEGLEWALASSPTDRRPLALVFRRAHWAPFRAVITDIEATFPASDIRMVDRWLMYRNAHVRVDAKMAMRFSVDARSFGRLSEIMTAIEPESPDNLILQQVQRKRRQSASGYIKKARKAPFQDLPEPFYSEMDKLFGRNAGLSVSRLKSVCVALRRLCKATENAGLPIGLNMDTAEAFVDGLFADDLTLRSIAGYCDFLACFAKHAGYPREIHAELMQVHNAVKYEAKTELRRKERKLAQHPIDLIDVASSAYDLLEGACDQDDIRNRRRDYVLAGAIGLLSKLQLRAYDLMHGEIGSDFTRDSEGWFVDLTTSKTGTPIKGRLAPALTRYLDAVLLMDVSERHLWSVYAQRVGTALFGNPAQGWNPYGKNWLWFNMSERLHHGPHIVRTLIYDAVAEAADLDAAVAQALCGHGNATSRMFYEVDSDRYRRKAGVQALAVIASAMDQGVPADQQVLD